MAGTRAIRFIVILTTIAVVLSGCLSQVEFPKASPTKVEIPIIVNSQPTATMPPNLPAEYFLPPYYSSSYTKIIEASKNETGLVIYSVLGSENWKPVIETFNSRYPWIEVTTVDLGANEVFERYNAESISGERTADLIITYAPDGWLNFANGGQIAPYISEEEFFIPPWTKLAPGVYTIASDPLVIVFNKSFINDPPESMAELVKLIDENTTVSPLRITSYDAAQNTTGLAINWFWIKQLGDSGWDILEKIGKSNPDLRTSGSSMVSSIVNGDSQIGYFISPVAFLPQIDQGSNLDWTYIHDGQPILMRSVAITKMAASPNSAKLMVDFLLSQEGQLALAMGGMTPFRPDISNVDIFKPVNGIQKNIHFNQVIEAVGLDNLIFINLDPDIINPDKQAQFIESWNKSMGR
jgi:iron(III) transport system substrate-binding protein